MTDGPDIQPLALDAGFRTRREAEVRHLLTGLEQELTDWKEAATARGPLEKHQSQIESAVRVVATALEQLRSLPAAERLDRAPELVLDLHHLWDFFRTKLTVRHIPQYKQFLDAADELAWAIYEPVRQAATDPSSPLREPPLTFLARHPVPFATARGSDFEDLLPSGAQRTLTGRRASRHLPFPLIGIPWSASHHLPSLLAAAHETGHHIEDDLDLAEPLLTRLRERTGLPAERVSVWEPWLGEVFADVCATLACGEAYARTLADALATTRDVASVSAYPPPRLRLQVCSATLAEQATVSRSEDHGSTEPTAVVHALIHDGFPELGGATLASLVALRHPDQLQQASLRLRNGLRSGRRDVPGVLAAAALTFLDAPDAYDDHAIGTRALQEVLSLVPRGARAGSVAENLLALRDSAAGRQLFDLLHRDAAPQQLVARSSRIGHH
ncbi:hypothetical protein [Streptomyces panaciradicis]|uniref:hypothetical protein n=1 Tax=Streptomyces panaciradicis TaxID=1470261 RepID=UPI00201CE370|nr:hypothetical protein [Streptomyces panaciradicis]MCL6671612.1 hypothetical protein [Streptomyces panaciradicis]